MISSYSPKKWWIVSSVLLYVLVPVPVLKMSLEALKKFCHHPPQKYMCIFATDTLDSIYHM